MHFRRSTPQVDSRMFSTDFPIISFAQNQTCARKTRPYAVVFAANTSSGRRVRTYDRCVEKHMLSLALCQRVPAPARCLPPNISWLICCGNALHFALYLCHRFNIRAMAMFCFYHSGFLTQSRETSAAAMGFALPRAVVLQIQRAPHGVALQLSSAAAVPCLSRIPADVVRPYVYAIQLRGTTLHIRDIGLFRSCAFWCAYS